jgi:hypothetical protein
MQNRSRHVTVPLVLLFHWFCWVPLGSVGFRCSLGFRFSFGFRWVPLFLLVPLLRCSVGFRWVPLGSVGFRCSVGFRVPLGCVVPLVPLFHWFALGSVGSVGFCCFRWFRCSAHTSRSQPVTTATQHNTIQKTNQLKTKRSAAEAVAYK